MARTGRFEESLKEQRSAEKQPGPGAYHPQTELVDRVRQRSCYMIKKPKIQNDYLYEFIGEAKVFRQDLLPKNQQREFDMLQKSYSSSRRGDYHLQILKPERINGQLLH